METGRLIDAFEDKARDVKNPGLQSAAGTRSVFRETKCGASERAK